MGLIFDKKIERIYEAWYHSSQGRTIERSIEHLILGLLDPKPGERVLDIGCGSGNHLLIFSRLGLDISGIDASPHMIHKAVERLGQRCALKTGTAESLPFEDNEFDLAVFINSLEFLDDPLQALREAGRVANRKVFVGVINSLSLNGLLRRAQGYLGNPLFNRARFYNLWQMKSLFQLAYGPIPVSWRCIKIRPPLIEGLMPAAGKFWERKHTPFAFFLGFSATMVYRIKTDNLPLKIRLKKAGPSLIGARTLEDLRRGKGVEKNEKGLPV